MAHADCEHAPKCGRWGGPTWRLTPPAFMRQGVGGLQAAAGRHVEQELYGAGSADPDGRSYTPDRKARSSRRPVAGGPAKGTTDRRPNKTKN
ncbi:MAG: hypothetical protein ACK4EX_02240 [Thermaurantimonas sp.]|uniref:hypothetical protein n=1 Tax=Thermaurantimonas sp. TaxID=2681568 RepID=UPI00391B9413